MIGRFIDSLDDVRRDRVITAQHWQTGGGVFTGRCLIQHAFDTSYWQHVKLSGGLDTFLVAVRFDDLCRCVGKRRAVRLCKLRAAKTRRVVAEVAT